MPSPDRAKACNREPSGDKAPELPAAAGSGEAAPGAAKQETNERGFVVRKLGEPACFGGAGEGCEGEVSFAVDKIEVDPNCAEYRSYPDEGHTVLLHHRDR